MLTETVAGRTYDYSHSVGRGAQTGMGFSNPVAATLGQDGILYVVNRGSESISNVAWNRTGVGQRICKVTLGGQAGEEEFIGEFSRYGDADGQLIWGTGVVADQQGNVYVSDEWLNRVSVFDKEGDFLRQWSTIQDGDGETNGAAGIAMDADENLYITDGRSHQVRKFTKDGKFLSSWGSLGDGPGELDSPWGITIDSEGFVYVADFKNHRVQKFTANVYVSDEWLNRVSVFDKEGDFLRQWSTIQDGDGETNGAAGIAMDADENLYITDGRSHQVRKFTKDGKFLSSWGSLGDGPGELDSPWGITIDSEGFVYVADFKNHRVQKFTADGEFVTQFGSHGKRRGQINYPTGVAVDPDGDVYICDWTQNDWEQGKVHIFDKDGKFLTSLSGDAQQLSKWAQMTVDANADYIKRRREVRTTEPEWNFAQPAGVSFDAANNRLVVMDTQRSRLQIYNKTGGYLVPQLNL